MSVAIGAVLLWGGYKSGPWLVIAAVAIPLLEIWLVPGQSWGSRLAERWPSVIMALSMLAIIALVPRLATQIAVAILYVGWRVVHARKYEASAGSTSPRLLGLLAVQAAMLEAVFLFAATKPVSAGLILVLLYAGTYTLVYGWLRTQSERSAGLLAAVWALVACQCGWVLLTWLVVYTTTGFYVIVPQPALVLAGLAYIFGGIYAAGRSNQLTRGRLTEYLLIGLMLIAIIVVGTKWQGTL